MTMMRLQQLAAVAPELWTAAEATAAHWSPEPPPPTVLAGDLARALAANFQGLPSSTVSAALDLCEEAILEGSPDEQATFATGFLEALQNADGRGTFDFQAIAALLGSASRAHCEAMDRFHGARTRGL